MTSNAPSVLPPLESPPNALLVLFSPGQWRWLTTAIMQTYAAQNAVLQGLGALALTVEGIMATVAELQSALDRNSAATTAAAAAINTEIAQLKTAIAALTTTAPPTQAQLDQLNASSTKLEAATAALGADDPAAPSP